MSDKHLYDKDDNYVGRISDTPPSSAGSGGGGPACGGCFVLALVCAAIAFIAGVVYPWYSGGPPDKMALDTLKTMTVLSVITGMAVFIEKRWRKR